MSDPLDVLLGDESGDDDRRERPQREAGSTFDERGSREREQGEEQRDLRQMAHVAVQGLARRTRQRVRELVTAEHPEGREWSDNEPYALGAEHAGMMPSVAVALRLQ